MSSSETLFEQAKRCIPGGVNSPVRAFRGVGGTPKFIARAAGAYLYDTEGKAYIDYVGAWGPMILGHNHPRVVAAVESALQDGMCFGAPTILETTLAEKICALMPAVDLVRMVNSGTEATMTAIRLARGVTGRDKILKFAGCYHGHSDSLLVNAGSYALDAGVPSSPGIPADFAKHTLTADYNDLEQTQAIFEKHGHDIAAIIVEPVAGNMSCIPPVDGFLPGLRALCDHYQSLLIFDEVMTGFRVALGGAQAYFHVTPDISTLGKVIGGGMPVGAVAGKRDVLSQLAPSGPVFQAGTLSGNPLAMAAGLATLNGISQPGFYERLTQSARTLAQGIVDRAQAAQIPMTFNQIGTMFGLFFTAQPNVTNFTQVDACDREHYQRYFHAMLGEGVYFAPSAYESSFISSQHDAAVIETTLTAAEKVLSCETTTSTA